jgi:citrate synthase
MLRYDEFFETIYRRTGEKRMENKNPQLVRGLRDVIAGETQICLLDEPNQRLYYRGYAIEDLAAHSNFEDVAHLLVYGEFPQWNKEWEEAFREGLTERPQFWDKAVFATLRSQNREANPMNVLQTLVAVCGNAYSHLPSSLGLAKIGIRTEGEAVLDKYFGLRLVASIGYFVGAMKRRNARERPLRMPNAYVSLAKNILYQM